MQDPRNSVHSNNSNNIGMNKMAARAHSFGGNYKRNQNESADISHVVHNNADDSLFGQFGNMEEY